MIELPAAQTPPFSVEAEMSVVGGMFIDPSVVATVLETIGEDDFFTERNRRVFRAFDGLYSVGSAIDEVTVVEQLRAQGDLEFVGGAHYLSELMEAVPVAANIQYHVGIVAHYSARRKLLAAAKDVEALARAATDESPEALQAEAERLISAVSPRVQGPGLVWVKELLWPEMERLERLGQPDEKVIGVRTGIRAIDDKLGSMEPGDLILVAGRPSMGKSALGVCNIAADAAIRQRMNVALFSIETRRDRMMTRLLQSEGRVNMAAAKMRKRILDEEYPRLAQAAGILNVAQLSIDHTPGLTIDQARVRARKMIRERGPIGLAVFDYLQLMSDPKAKDPRIEVSRIGTGLKRFAQEFECPVVALSQLSRAVESRTDKRPMMSDLRESGTLEQDADVIMLLYRPEYYHGPTMEKKGQGVVSIEGVAEIILAKVRDGATGTAHCIFEKEFTHFKDWS